MYFVRNPSRVKSNIYFVNLFDATTEFCLIVLPRNLYRIQRFYAHEPWVKIIVVVYLTRPRLKGLLSQSEALARPIRCLSGYWALCQSKSSGVFTIVIDINEYTAVLLYTFTVCMTCSFIFIPWLKFVKCQEYRYLKNNIGTFPQNNKVNY